jgi:hypothetical protein
MTLAAERMTAVVFAGRVVMQGRRPHRDSRRAASLLNAQVPRQMSRTVTRYHAVHLLVRLGHDSLRRLPLQTDGELKHEQR